MKILHTADWHLGQKFINQERHEEHQFALDWLLEVIRKENIDLLLVAGDIFDIANPNNKARTLYYNFLAGVEKTNCSHVVITGGNHDSPSMLNAPSEYFKNKNIHIVGCATENIEDELLLLKNNKDEIECIVAAVPFLRDQDIRRSVEGESGTDRVGRIKEGIYNHYRDIGTLAEKYEEKNVPILATGHLYATGAEASGKQDNIYIGNIDNIDADNFPAVFDYVALGHLHRPQLVGQLMHVRYSGSLIPLSFSEREDKKVVKVIEFKNREMAKGVKEIPVPPFRQLISIRGDIKKIKNKLKKVSSRHQLPAWVELQIETDTVLPNIDAELRDFSADMPLEILKIRTQSSHQSLDTQVDEIDLTDLEPIEVFEKKCESAGQPPEDWPQLKETFLELLDWMKTTSDS